MTESIHQVLESLPETSLTTRLLGALDYIVPGTWQNITHFDEMIRNVTGDSDEALVQSVGEKAMQLWFDESLGYQRAVQIYHVVDDVGTVAGAAALANMASQRFEILGFLGDVTPKPDQAQAVDAAVKFAAELVAFCTTNGFPGDSIGDFAGALTQYGKEDLMRIAAWLAIDCVLPLGPDFMRKIVDAVDAVEESELANHRVFRFVAEHLPGDWAQKRDVVKNNMASAEGYLQNLVSSGNIEQSSLLAKVREYVDIADDKLDLVAASLDLATNYYEHTGVQSVTRRIIGRAYAEI